MWYFVDTLAMHCYVLTAQFRLIMMCEFVDHIFSSVTIKTTMKIMVNWKKKIKGNCGYRKYKIESKVFMEQKIYRHPMT